MAEKKIGELNTADKAQKDDINFRLEEDSIFKIEGLYRTVTTTPTGTPTKLSEQVVIYVDSISSPSTKRLYIYSNATNSWHYVALT